MKHLFVPYELALKLKEKGFNEPCITKFETYINKTKLYPVLGTLGLNTPYENEYHGYDQRIINDTERQWVFTGYKNSVLDHGNSIVSAPLYQQVIDWFREKHKMHFSVVYSHDHNKYSCEVFDQFHADELKKRNPRSEGRFPYPYKMVCIPHYWHYTTYYEALNKAIEEALKLI